MELLTIIGSGTMGHSIALNAAWSGINVRMYGLNEQDSSNGLAGISRKLQVLLANDLITENQTREILDRIKVTNSIDDSISGATFIIETIPEDIQLKNNLFLDLDKKCSPDVILASNTSGLSLTQMSAGINHPERTIITHFWNPAHLIPLVEVLRSSLTTTQTFDRAISLLKSMGKKPIEVKKEVPGLVGNRLQFALFREAQYLLEEGIASKEDIDAAVTYSIGRRLSVTGPLLSADMGGLDVFASISDNLFKNISDADHSFPTLEKLVEEKKLGDKTGEGYYMWDKEFSAKKNLLRENELIRQLKSDREANQA
jgi:3-hydroxybutyryl-CoA dehydrogenase